MYNVHTHTYARKQNKWKLIYRIIEMNLKILTGIVNFQSNLEWELIKQSASWEVKRRQKRRRKERERARFSTLWDFNTLILVLAQKWFFWGDRIAVFLFSIKCVSFFLRCCDVVHSWSSIHLVGYSLDLVGNFFFRADWMFMIKHIWNTIEPWFAIVLKANRVSIKYTFNVKPNEINDENEELSGSFFLFTSHYFLERRTRKENNNNKKSTLAIWKNITR